MYPFFKWCAMFELEMSKPSKGILITSKKLITTTEV